jgi:hypothetical protein
MTEQEKIAQLSQAAPSQGVPNDLEILFPKPAKWTLGEKEYELRPFRFSEIEMLDEIQNINPATVSRDDLDKILSLVSSVLKEPDKQFIKDNMDPIELQDLIETVMKLNSTGIPVNKKKAMLARRDSAKA